MKKYSFLLLIIGLGVLVYVTDKIIIPLSLDVARSDLFLVGSKDKASPLPISTPLTDIAFMHCNNYIKSKLDPETSITFPKKPINAWSFGNHQYLVNAEITISTEKSSTQAKKYACRITYNNGDTEEGTEDFNNWTIEGLSGLDNL